MALLAGFFSLSPVADRIENQYALSLLYAIRQPVEPPTGAVVVAIDNETISWLRDQEIGFQKSKLLACLPTSVVGELDRVRGPGSLPRAVHACLLEELKRIGFPVVVFDILFSVPGDHDDDQKFAAALRDYGPTVILVGFERSVVRDGASELLVEREVKPLELYQKSATSVGAFILPRTAGPIYGYWPQVAGFPDAKSLPEEAHYLYNTPRAEKARETMGGTQLKYFWLYGPPGSIETVSAQDILRGEFADRLRAIAGKSVAFVGASDPATTNFLDSFPSFFRGGSDANISGVELAATAYLNLFHGESVGHLPLAMALMLIAMLSGILGFLARANAAYAIVAIPLAAVIYLTVATTAFIRHGFLLPFGTPLFVVMPMIFLVAVFVRYRFAKALIMHLAPAPVARRMLTKTTDMRGSAIYDEATIVFFDVIGSTAIGETIPALDFNNLLNTYHETVARAAAKQRGFISAFTGDGAVAVFSKTDAGLDHAVRACQSVLTVIREIRTVNAANAKVNLPSLAMRVGINSGVVAEGEMGALDRFNFSVVGDVVNLAARLEQLGKTLFPGEKDVILVGHSTKQMANRNGLHFINCGKCKIKGRENPETVYRLTAD